MSQLLTFRSVQNNRKNTQKPLVRGFAPFAVTGVRFVDLIPSTNPDRPVVLYLEWDFYDYEGLMWAAGFQIYNSEYIENHEFRVYRKAPWDDDFVALDRNTIGADEFAPDGFTPCDASIYCPRAFDIAMIPGVSYTFQVSVYNKEKDAEGPRTDFTYTCPTFQKPENLSVQTFGSQKILTWDYPDQLPMSGSMNNTGPGYWKVTANGVELNRYAGGEDEGFGPAAPAQLLTGVVDPVDIEFIVTPIFRDMEGNIYEYESSAPFEYEMVEEGPALPEITSFTAIPGNESVEIFWEIDTKGESIINVEMMVDIVGDKSGFWSGIPPLATGSLPLSGFTNGNEVTIWLRATTSAGQTETDSVVRFTPVAPEPVTFYTDFSEYATGEQPSDWAKEWHSEIDVWIVQESAEATNGKLLKASGNNFSDRRVLKWNQLDEVEDCVIQYKFRVHDVQANPMALVRGSGSGSSERGYVIGYRNNDTRSFRINRYNLASFSALIENNDQLSENTWYIAKISALGNALKLKIWQDGLPEPGTWDLETSDNAIAGTGWTGIFSIGIGDYDIDWYEVEVLG